MTTATATPSETDWGIEALGVHKRWGTVVALDGADFRARFGEVHALLGENGAGKSTLVRTLTGAATPDQGTLRLDGNPIAFDSHRDASSEGIAAVYQELSLIGDLTVAENIFLGREPTRAGFTRRRYAAQSVRALFADLGLEPVDPHATVGSLPLAQQQIVEIVKVLARKPRVLVLDEATSSLPRQQVMWLFDVVRGLAMDGVAVFIISHRLGEAYEIADRCTVFRAGRTVATGPLAQFSEDELVQHMIGRELAEGGMRRPTRPSEEIVLEVNGLGLGTRFRSVDFSLHKGEVLGIGGLQGQGQAELLLSLYGWYKPQGEVRFNDREVEFHSPRAALKAGIAYVPEDRRTQGLLLGQSIRENLTLPALSEAKRFAGLLPQRSEDRMVRAAADRFRIRAQSLEAEVRTLSGGNQQKVLIAKCLSDNIQVLLLADVTRGIDIGAKADFYQLLGELTSHGIAVIWASSDVAELTSLCHRVAVMFDHTIEVILEGSAVTEQNIVHAAVSGAITDGDGHAVTM